MGWGIPVQGWRKGPWTPEEDKLLTEYVKLHEEGRWSSVARFAGLNRSGKSCRLRWVNYLRPGLKRGQITPQEEGIIIELHALWGNKWSTIARYLPGRTDNEIKNYWRTHFRKEKTSKKLIKSQILNQKLNQKQHQKSAGDDQMKRVAETSDGKIQQENNTLEDQCLPVICQDVSDFLMDDGLWGSMWNLDDHSSNCSSQIAKYSHCNYYINGGYIF